MNAIAKDLGSRLFDLIPGQGTRNKLRAAILVYVRPYVPIQMLVEPGETMLQVGTPNEITVRSLAKRVGNNGHVVVVEASTASCAAVEAAQQKLGLEGARITIHHKAAYSHRDKLQLELSGVYPGDNQLIIGGIEVDNHAREGQDFNAVEEVVAMPLDDLLTTFPSIPSSVVITINGAELAAVQGATKLLESMPKGSRVFVKTHALLDSGETIFTAVRNILEKAGFEVVKSKASSSVSAEDRWNVRRGDAFGYKP